jgi:hypothetical protein
MIIINVPMTVAMSKRDVFTPILTVMILMLALKIGALHLWDANTLTSPVMMVTNVLKNLVIPLLDVTAHLYLAVTQIIALPIIVFLILDARHLLLIAMTVMLALKTIANPPPDVYILLLLVMIPIGAP